MGDLCGLEVAQLYEVLRDTASLPESHEWAQLESPDPEGRVRGAAAWMERAARELPEEHPLAFWRPR